MKTTIRLSHQHLLWMFGGFIAVILMGCPYKSKVPIAPAEEKTDGKLLGKWVKSKDVTQDNPEYFEIKKYDKNKYEIDKWTYNSYDSTYKMERFISHINTIDDIAFLNMQKDGTGDYFLYKIDYNPKDLTLYEITDNIDETFNSSEEMKAFVEANMRLSFFYNKDEVKYVKKE